MATPTHSNGRSDAEPLRERSVQMDSSELQARAAIAAALIVSRAVEIPSVPPRGFDPDDPATMRLRELTDYVYLTIVTPMAGR